MTPHEALLKAQEVVNFPKYDQRRQLWIVVYKKNGKRLEKTFKSDNAAYNFFYQKLRQVKNDFLSGKDRER